MSLALLVHYLLLNMFRMFVHPSSGACDILWIYGLYCSGPMYAGVTVWFGWGGVVSLCRLKQCFSLHKDTTQSQPNHTVTPTHIEPEQYNLRTPCCRVLPEQLTGLQLLKKFPTFHGTRRFITALTSVRHLSLYPGPVQSSPHAHIQTPGDPS